MIERQKRIIINANLNVEATGILFEIRQALRGSSCTENFSGLSLNTDPGIIESIKMEYDNGTEWPRVFPTGEIVEGSPGNLKIASYSLDPIGKSQRKRDGVSFLKVNFTGPKENEQIHKEVKLFVKMINGKISECSLNPFSDSHYFWKDQGDFLSSSFEYFQINSEKTYGTLNLFGGVIVTPSVLGCNHNQIGTIFWSEENKNWMICKNEGFTPFNDSRVFTELGLKKMGDGK